MAGESGAAEASDHRRIKGFVVDSSAFAASYALTYLFLILDGIRSAIWESAPQDSMVEFTGLVLYNAQFVDIYTVDDAGGGHQGYNLLTDPPADAALTETVPGFVYLLAPVLVLVAGGYLLYQWVGRPQSWESAAMLGLNSVPGYLLLSYVGNNAFTVPVEGRFVFRVRADVSQVVLVAGILYPALWCGVGAVIGYVREAQNSR